MNDIKRFIKIIFASTISLAVLSVIVSFFDTKKETENSVKLTASPVVKDTPCDNFVKGSTTTSSNCIIKNNIKK